MVLPSGQNLTQGCPETEKNEYTNIVHSGAKSAPLLNALHVLNYLAGYMSFHKLEAQVERCTYNIKIDSCLVGKSEVQIMLKLVEET